VRISFAAAEVAPYAKVGGLADVAAHCHRRLPRSGTTHRLLPYHRSIDGQKFGIRHPAREPLHPYGAAAPRIEYPEISRDGVRTVVRP